MFLIYSLLFGFLRGIKEGMVMLQDKDIMHTGIYPAVRGHAWFDFYHAISVIVFILFGLAIYQYIKKKPNILYLLGTLLLVWQLTEMGENFSRYATPIILHEHLNLADIIKININGYWVYLLHIVRTILGTTIIYLVFNATLQKNT